MKILKINNRFFPINKEFTFCILDTDQISFYYHKYNKTERPTSIIHLKQGDSIKELLRALVYQVKREIDTEGNNVIDIEELLDYIRERDYKEEFADGTV